MVLPTMSSLLMGPIVESQRTNATQRQRKTQRAILCVQYHTYCMVLMCDPTSSHKHNTNTQRHLTTMMQATAYHHRHARGYPRLPGTRHSRLLEPLN